MSHYVLVHGGWEESRAWEDVVPVLEQSGHTVTAIDLPGHGHSPGRRGHIPGFDTVGRILTHARTAFETRVGHLRS